MDFIKQYITQCITIAANSLRLTTQQIEIVALLKEEILDSFDLKNDVKAMKKVTELSTLAIKLNNIIDFLENGNIDFLKLSDTFREHSRNLIRDLSILLETTNPTNFKLALDNLIKFKDNDVLKSKDYESKRSFATIDTEDESDTLKEKFILDVESDEEEILLQQFETSVVSTIKPFDEFLSRIQDGDFEPEEISYYINIFSNNVNHSRRFGFDLIANMNSTLKNCLELVKSKKINVDKELIKDLRACLIVIAAIIRKKDVDISNFLSRAESLSRKISNKS
jgi:hypothetical protein